MKDTATTAARSTWQTHVGTPASMNALRRVSLSHHCDIDALVRCTAPVTAATKRSSVANDHLRDCNDRLDVMQSATTLLLLKHCTTVDAIVASKENMHNGVDSRRMRRVSARVLV